MQMAFGKGWASESVFLTDFEHLLSNVYCEKKYV
jgi:hypothetical protein